MSAEQPSTCDSDYLRVDAYLGDVVGARALQSALTLGLIDRLETGAPCTLAELSLALQLDELACRLLLGMLHANGVVSGGDFAIQLTPEFRKALAYRDLIEAKLDFVCLVAPDFLRAFDDLLTAPQRFFEEARLFELFSYDRCFDPAPGNIENTRRWMKFTTALTRYESAPCIARHDFSRYCRLLDVGGNSGEFALSLCRRHPQLQVSVLDLPLVCEIGVLHVAGQAEANRIDFIKSSGFGYPFPAGQDAVTFKSMLHDWPDLEAGEFITQAYAALNQGGTLLIFERCPLDIGTGQLPYSLIPIMLFFRSYRKPEVYLDLLERAGFRHARSVIIELEVPFMLVTAEK